MNSILLTQYDGAILGPIAKVLGVIMNGIFWILDKIGIPNIGLAIILFTIVFYLLLMPLTVKQQKYMRVSSLVQPEIQKIVKKYKGKTDEVSQRRMQAAFAHWMQTDPGLLQAVHDCNRADILMAMHNKYKERVRTVLLPRLAGDDSKADCTMAALISLMVGTLIFWVEGGRQQTAEELYSLFTDSLHTLEQVI